MKVTVLIAAYNAAEHIAGAVESVLCQSLSGSKREILVVDDGSSDGTLDTLGRFEGTIRVLDEPHRGLVSACNVGLAAAQGDYVLRLDADDSLAPDALLMMVRSLDENPGAGCVYSDRIEIMPDGQKVHVSLAEFNVFRTIACGVLFRTEIARAIGGYDDLLFEEYDFLIRYLRANPRRVHLALPLYLYVKHAANMTGQPGYWERGWQQIIQKWGETELARWNFRQVYQRP